MEAAKSHNGSQLSEIKTQPSPADVMGNHFWQRLCDVWQFKYLLRNDLLMGLLTLLSLTRHYRPLIVYMRTGDN